MTETEGTIRRINQDYKNIVYCERQIAECQLKIANLKLRNFDIDDILENGDNYTLEQELYENEETIRKLKDEIEDYQESIFELRCDIKFREVDLRVLDEGGCL